MVALLGAAAVLAAMATPEAPTARHRPAMPAAILRLFMRVLSYAPWAAACAMPVSPILGSLNPNGVILAGAKPASLRTLSVKTGPRGRTRARMPDLHCHSRL